MNRMASSVNLRLRLIHRRRLRLIGDTSALMVTQKAAKILFNGLDMTGHSQEELRKLRVRQFAMCSQSRWPPELRPWISRTNWQVQCFHDGMSAADAKLKACQIWKR